MYFLAVAVLIAAGVGLVLNRVKRISVTFDGAALVVIGAVFGFLIAAILTEPSSVPRLAAVATPNEVTPSVVPAVGGQTEVAKQVAGAATAPKMTKVGFRAAGAFHSSRPLVVPVGSPLVVMGSFNGTSEAVAAPGAVSVLAETDPVAAHVSVRGNRFDIEVPTRDLVPGAHTISMTFHELDGTHHALEPIGVVLVSPSVAAPPSAVGNAPEASVDVFADITAQPQRNLTVSVGRPALVVLQGWAFDDAAHRPANEVLVSIDGKMFYRATTGLRRPDVAQARSAAYLTSGFTAVLPVTDLGASRHDVAVMTVGAGIRHVLALKLTLDVR